MHQLGGSRCGKLCRLTLRGLHATGLITHQYTVLREVYDFAGSFQFFQRVCYCTCVGIF
jgi:hypothetical protein